MDSKLIGMGLKPSMVILEEVPEGASWEDAECRWIAAANAQGWPLTNTQAGGNGSAPLNEQARERKFERMRDPETRKKMSDAAKARWGNKEKRERALAGLQSDERRRRQAESAKARATPEYRAAASERMRAMWADPEKRAKIVAGITEETRAAVSQAAKRMWENSTPEKKAQMLANLESSQ